MLDKRLVQLAWKARESVLKEKTVSSQRSLASVSEALSDKLPGEIPSSVNDSFGEQKDAFKVLEVFKDRFGID